MQITWLGTASLLMEENGVRLAVDPYLRRTGHSLPPFPLETLKDVQGILITHPHLDHFADIAEVMQVCSAPVYVSHRGIEIARKENMETNLLARLVEIKPGDELVFDDLCVHVWQSQHCMFDARLVVHTLIRAVQPKNIIQALRLAHLNAHYCINLKRDVLAFEVAALDSRAFVLGSAALSPDVSYPADCDMLIYPYQGRSDMASYSISLLKQLGPRCVILDHFDDAFPPVSHAMDTSELKRLAHVWLPDMEIKKPVFGVPYSVR